MTHWTVLEILNGEVPDKFFVVYHARCGLTPRGRADEIP